MQKRYLAKIIATDNIMTVLNEALTKKITPIKWNEKEEGAVADASLKENSNKNLVRH